LRIVVDWMADQPEAVLTGVRELSLEEEFRNRIVLVGPKRLSSLIGTALLQPTEEWVGMEEEIEAVRKKASASINLACQMVKNGSASALVSAGNSKATVFAAFQQLGMLSGISRPAIGVLFPSARGQTLVLDCGATVDAKPVFLLQWAMLGKIFMETVLEKEDVSVGILNNGTESTKGNKLTKEARFLFEQYLWKEFVGYQEYIFSGGADILVCDGFVGNLILKNLEDGLSFFHHDSISYARYGGALLFGINYPVIICHGKSNAEAVKNGIRLAKRVVDQQVILKIKDRINKERFIFCAEV